MDEPVERRRVGLIVAGAVVVLPLAFFTWKTASPVRTRHRFSLRLTGAGDFYVDRRRRSRAELTLEAAELEASPRVVTAFERLLRGATEDEVTAALGRTLGLRGRLASSGGAPALSTVRVWPGFFIHVVSWILPGDLLDEFLVISVPGSAPGERRLSIVHLRGDTPDSRPGLATRGLSRAARGHWLQTALGGWIVEDVRVTLEYRVHGAPLPEPIRRAFGVEGSWLGRFEPGAEELR